MAGINEILESMKKDGHRLTKIRKSMIEILFSEKCLLSTSEILVRLSQLQMKPDRTTIYRELCFLLDRKIIRRIQLGNGKAYYEICDSHHHHLICTKCHKVKEVILGDHLEKQEKDIYKKEKFKVAAHTLEFYGLCGNCL